MPLVEDRSMSQLAFQLAGGDADRFQVARYRGTEGLCQLYRFELELITTDTAVAFDEIVGKAAVLSINTVNGERWFHGIVSRFELTNQTEGQTYFRAELVPGIWLLTHRHNSRIFQNKTVKDIITDVLTQAGFSSDRFQFNLSGTHPTREYCVQYRETDYNFISRLMEEEGIWWHFEQTQDSHVLAMADSTAAYTPLEGETALPFVPPSGMSNEVEHVFRFRLGQAVRPGAVVLNDFNFKNPALDLKAIGDGGRDPGLEFFDYPGEYTEQSAGTNLAGMRVEEFEAGRTVGVGQSTSYRLASGYTFDLTEHPIESLNGSYLITAVTHQGKQATLRASTGADGRGSIIDGRTQQSLLMARQDENETIRQLAEALLQIGSRFKSGDQSANRALTHWMYHAGQVSRDLANVAAAAGSSPLEALSLRNLIEDVAQNSLIDYDAPVYESRFECIPSSLTFRPPRVTPWPMMRGAQTARVVGPSGEEIHTDEYGRVKVQFNWDREGKFDDKASCWIRVAQGMAGGGYGLLFLPRVGQEVIVDFLEGDPDQPIITGRVYNADHMPPYTLPDEKTKSVIKTHSSKGGGGTNEILFEDLKDSEQILIYAQKDLHVRVNSDRVENVGHDRHLTVEEQKFELIKQNKHSEVKLDLNEKVGGNMSLDVTGDVGEKFGGNHQEDASNIYLKGGSNVVVEAGTGLTLKCGGNFVKIDSSGVTILGTMVKINSGGSAGSGSAVSPTAPEAPTDAITATPGQDTTYTGGEELPPGEVEPEAPGLVWEPEEVEEKITSWIEIELVDEDGQPVPGERYEITMPDGETIKKGTTSNKGQAHVSVPEPGTCQISFPALDAEAWERAGGGGSGGGAGGGSGAGGSGGAAQSGGSGGSGPAGGDAAQAQSSSSSGGGDAARSQGSSQSPGDPADE
ncbi:MAG: type VI secretion system tip protein VgrG [Phycisphaerae bacterium]|nr:type VI secretion system tip protein VgrG [Phycisphaerae bacterium]